MSVPIIDEYQKKKLKNYIDTLKTCITKIHNAYYYCDKMNGLGEEYFKDNLNILEKTLSEYLIKIEEAYNSCLEATSEN